MTVSIVLFCIGCVLFVLSVVTMHRKVPPQWLEYTMPLAYGGQAMWIASAVIALF